MVLSEAWSIAQIHPVSGTVEISISGVLKVLGNIFPYKPEVNKCKDLGVLILILVILH